MKIMQKAQSIYQEYPRQFWLLVGASFVDAVGGALIAPFLTLYVTVKFSLPLTQVGIIFGTFSVASLFGTALGGALADRFGRKGVMIFGLIASALSSILLGVVTSVGLFLGIALVTGLVANAGGPARQAMLADILPEEKRAQGFGISHVVFNLAVTIGPAIGGFFAGRSYLLLFVFDALTSVITASIVYAFVKESKPTGEASTSDESTASTMLGYTKALRDGTFMLFILASMLMLLAYMQMNTTLGVYMRDVQGMPEQWYGALLSLNAVMVVLFQFPITRRIEGFPPFLVMSAGLGLLAVGFGMFGLASIYPMFVLAMMVLTVGEMLITPFARAVVAQLAPEDMRGRYMAVYSLSWIVPNAVAVSLAGLVMESVGPSWVWYAAAMVLVMAMGVLLLLHKRELARSAEEPADGAVGVSAADDSPARGTIVSST